ncbi:MAG: ATP synthase F1 subunit gamma [Clostridiales bacterium]|nr:ATP synthase F1 subunit gamma [Clostridiales bacterium]
MANTKEIQSRMKSIQDTMKITNAMYMISSSKLKKSKKSLEDTEPYFYTLQSTMSRILRHIPDIKSIYFDQRENKSPSERHTGYIVVTADKGMAGAYNHNVLKVAEEHLQQSDNPVLFVLGELGRQYFEHKKFPIEEQFHYTVQNPTLNRARNIAETILEWYSQEKLDEVYIIYTRMVNAVQAEAEVLQLLPLKKADFSSQSIPIGVKMEELALLPTPEAVMNRIVPDYIVGFIYGALVESYSSEQNSRMMAMQAATDSAKDMLKELDILYNRARQAAITQEITVVIAGAKAQKKKKEQGGK